jgi:putative chitinase
MRFTAKTLAAVCASTVANAQKYVEELNAFGNAAGLTTANRVAMFCAQITYESMRLSRVEENLNYTTPQRLMAVWPSRFPNLPSAAPYVRNPRALANKVYNGRMGNVLGSDDGWNYRGRGLKQLTGKDNYTWMSDETGIDFVTAPDLVSEPHYAAMTAVHFWTRIDGNSFADAGDFRDLTIAINGGLIGYEDGNDTGLDDRVELYEYANAKLLALGEQTYGV